VATEVGGIYYKVDLDDRELHRKVPGVTRAVHGIAGSFEAAANASKALGLGLLAAGGIAAGFIGYGAKIAGDLEASRQGFITLLGSAKEADKVLALIKKDAKTTPFELPGLIQANQMLTSITKDGVKSEKILMDIGKALAAMGRGQPELDRMMVNLQQIGAVGHASMIDIKQFAFAGIPIFEMLGETIGKTGDDLSDFISEGGVTFEMLTKMFDEASNGSGRFAKAFENQAGTFKQLMSNMKDSISIAMVDFLRATGIFDGLKKAVKLFTDFLANHQDDMVKFATKFLDYIKDNAPIVIGLIAGGLAPAFLKLAFSIAAGTAVLSPWMLAGAALALTIKLVIDRLGGWQEAWKKITNNTKIKDFLEEIAEKATMAKDALELLITGKTKEGTLGQEKSAKLGDKAAESEAGKGEKSLYGGAKGLSDLQEKILSVRDGIKEVIGYIQGFIDKLFVIRDNLMPIFKKIWEEIWPKVSDTFKGIWDAVQRINDSLTRMGWKWEWLAYVVLVPVVIGIGGLIGILKGLEVMLRITARSLEIVVGLFTAMKDAASKALDSVKTTLSGEWITKMKFGFRASGGDVRSGSPYIVGEEGPELFVPQTSGYIYSHDKTKSMASTGGGSVGVASQELHLHLHPEGLIATDRKQVRDASLLLMEEFNNAAAAHGWTPVGDGKVQAP